MVDEDKNSNGKIETKFWVPKNDNLKPILERNIGPQLVYRIDAMLNRGELREVLRCRSNGHFLELHAARGEDIARRIIEDADTRDIGITGSDLVLAIILAENNQYHFFEASRGERGKGKVIWTPDIQTKDYYTNPGEIVEEGLRKGTVLRFMSADRTAKMTVLGNYEIPPFLCALGANDITYDQLIQRRRERGEPVRAVWEDRYAPLAMNFLYSESIREGFEFLGRSVTGSAEGYIRKGEEEEREDLADVAIDIGRTFKTARGNKLSIYKRIMQTYPVALSCCKKGEEEGRRDLDMVVREFEKAMAS